jgi:hypothetical protein
MDAGCPWGIVSANNDHREKGENDREESNEETSHQQAVLCDDTTPQKPM